MIHTGDITHLSKPNGIRRRREDHLAGQARRALRAGRARHHRRGAQALQGALRPRHARAPAGTSFDADGVHFIGLVNVAEPQGRRPGQPRRGAARMARGRSQGQDRRRRRSWCSRISRCGSVYPQWGWGTDDGAQALDTAQALRLGDRAQRPHPSGDAEGRRQRHLPHRALDRVPAAGAGQRRRRPAR